MRDMWSYQATALGINSTWKLGCVHAGKGRFWPPWYLLLSTVLLLVSILSYIPAPNMAYLKYAALGSIAVGAPFVARRGWAALRTWRLDINVLMVIAMAGKHMALLLEWHSHWLKCVLELWLLASQTIVNLERGSAGPKLSHTHNPYLCLHLVQGRSLWVTMSRALPSSSSSLWQSGLRTSASAGHGQR